MNYELGILIADLKGRLVFPQGLPFGFAIGDPEALHGTAHLCKTAGSPVTGSALLLKHFRQTLRERMMIAEW
jgi:hypothetical protein